MRGFPAPRQAANSANSPLRNFGLKRFAFKPYGLSFRGKTLFFRSVRAGRRGAAASRFAFFKGRKPYPLQTLQG